MMSSNYALMISLGYLPLPHSLTPSLALSICVFLPTPPKLRLILKKCGDEMLLKSSNCHTNLMRAFSLGIFDVICLCLGTDWCLLAVIGTSCFKKGIRCMTLMAAVASSLLRVEEPSPSMHPRALRPCHLLKEVVTTK